MSASSNGGVHVQRGAHVCTDPVVSVIIPVWRRDAATPCWIDEALDSVRAQTLPRWEVIVVDDGSPVPIAPARVDDIVLVRQPNAGPGGARNRGVALARAPLVAFLDSDDRYRPRKLERQVALHARRPELVLSATSYLNFDAHGARPRVAAPSAGTTEITFEQLFFENCIACSSAMLPRGAYGRAGGMAHHRRLGEDYGLWLRLAMRGPIGYLEDALVEHRVHPDSLGQTHRREGTMLAREREVYDEFLAEHPAFGRSPFVAAARARVEHEEGWTRLQTGAWLEARRRLVHSLRLDPRRPRVWIDLARTFLRI